jgi:hypothetical protein
MARGVGEFNINTALGDDSTVSVGCAGIFIPVAVNQAGSRSCLHNGTAVEFRHPEIAKSGRGNIDSITDHSFTAGVGVENPRHVIRTCRHGFCYFHEHADNPTGAVLDSEHIAYPALIQPYIGANSRPFVHAVLERPYRIAFLFSCHLQPRLPRFIFTMLSKSQKKKGHQGFP